MEALDAAITAKAIRVFFIAIFSERLTGNLDQDPATER
jgi:hypothetical protein